MTVIKWRDAYNTGVERFDAEHHKLVELIDAMFAALRDHAGKEAVEKICRDAVSYAEYHFVNEEKAMREAGYPEFDDHVAEHLRLKEKAEAFQVQIGERYPEGAQDFYRFLRDWLVQHIQSCDKKYGPYLKEASS